MINNKNEKFYVQLQNNNIYSFKELYEIIKLTEIIKIIDYVNKNGDSSNLNHRLRNIFCMFSHSCAFTACKNYTFHFNYYLIK